MSDLLQLTESDISRWVDEASFDRGRGYYGGGHIVAPRLQGGTLKARCLGSRPTPYLVQVTLGQKGIVSGDCSCPVGAGGHCKHAAALLLTWLHQSSAVPEVEELEVTLNQRSKTELVALVRRMVARHPDLEVMLELPTVGAADSEQLVDAEMIRRQANNAFHAIGFNDWAEIRRLVLELLDLADLGDEYGRREQWRNATTVYQAVAQATLDNYNEVQPEGGDFHIVVDRCVGGLEESLKATHDSVLREALLRALFDIYHWDVDFGGIEMGYQAPDIILEQATAEERQQVACWVREALPVGDSRNSDFHRQVYGGFLLGLEEDRLDDEGFLRLCRETSRWGDLVDRLLTLGRVDEAVGVARERRNYGLLQLTGIFASHNRADLAEDLVRERLWVAEDPDRRDSRLIIWLQQRAQARGDLAEALTLAHVLFWQRPGVERYQELDRLAGLLGQWENVRTSILSRLTGDGRYRLLTEIYLEEGRIDGALKIVAQIDAQRSRWGWTASSLRMKVAQAAEADRPREAIHLYTGAVERLIAARGRGKYAEAAQYLVRVRDLYERLDERESWYTLIADLREQNRRLPALRDELNRAGL